MGYQATHLDYVCAGCGAQAESVPSPDRKWGTTVVVPHGPGCPVAAQVAAARTRVRVPMRPQ